ncbi:hypothetical protein [Mesorhizobium sp. M7A.F.Ca.US.008.03.1.1]|uniref:TOTE conflict system archaeo-eukaryotic primase domain-containing protein n=1 Tax=Mesorhizobium sp. M7A.F.Ca.US.008.03.1.1 TaxID=2496742 RepID=UPI000FCADEE5|nr:hypothetical protein [Mesorhizobium sp. M7A.F.Ca.US.008.03.1.1]RUW58353.1 hypothetical protein EOA16_27990 [Mesorhizobium sp. M7A.F.Ca.US.008.03.1.1]
MGQITEDHIIALSKRFEGYEFAHGKYDIKRVSEKGKNEGKAVTYSTPPTLSLWEAHVKGEGAGLGIIPLRSDNTLLFGCIDIDVFGIDHKALEAKCKELGLPLVICRSKSGGAHCYLFLKEPVQASIVVDALSAWAAALGYGGCEIFPKQTVRYDGGDGAQKDIGNWLNMPYQYALRTTRYCVKDGEPIDLAQFLDHADAMSVTEEELDALSIAQANDDDMFDEGPPCLQYLRGHGGLPDGSRNEGMYNVAVYLKKRFPDDWQDKLQTYNVAMCDPPIGLAEVNTVQKSVDKKDYDYRCTKAPIQPHCMRRKCLGQKHGVGGGSVGGGDLEISHLAKHEGNPVLWFATIGGKRMMLTTDELTNQLKFRSKVFATIQRMPRSVPAPRWERYLDDLGKDCEVIEVAEEMLDIGRFRNLLDVYLLGQARTTTKEQLADSLSPFITGDGEVWFRVEGLLRHLDRHGFKHPSTLICKWLRDECGARDSQLHVKGKNLRIWKIREPVSSKEPDPENHFGSEVF